VIRLRRPNGHRLILNADLIETIEASDDGSTSIVLTTGNLVVVAESPDTVREAVIAYRRAIGGGRMIDAALAVRLVSACAIVALVLVAIDVLARRAFGVRPRLRRYARLFEVVESISLPGGASLHAVRAGDRYVLLARSASSVVSLGDLPVDAVLHSFPNAHRAGAAVVADPATRGSS